jgi:hypothetical protein
VARPGASRIAFDRAHGQLVLFGGLGDDGVLGDSWIGTNGGWHRVEGPGPPARNVHAMTYDALRERVVMYGGIADGGRLDDLWEWDGREWREIRQENRLPGNRDCHENDGRPTDSRQGSAVVRIQW